MWLITIPQRMSGFRESLAWITKLRVSLQNVAYSFGRSSKNDSISKIDDRMSDRYFCFVCVCYGDFLWGGGGVLVGDMSTTTVTGVAVVVGGGGVCVGVGGGSVCVGVTLRMR